MKKGLIALASIVLSLVFVQAQTIEQSKIWQHLDLEDDSIPGISLYKAYDFVADKPSKKVRVAIIDSGYDLDHEALKKVVWTNTGEIAGNGLDDDGNGYVDDINGWNFIGGKGENVINDTYELTREYARLQAKYGSAKTGKGKEWEYWKEIEENYLSSKEETFTSGGAFMERYNSIKPYFQLLQGYLRVDTLSVELLNTVDSEDSVVQEADAYLTRLLTYVGGSGVAEDILALMEPGREYYDYQLNYAYNTEFEPRSIVGDDYANKTEIGYGNNQVDDVSGFGGAHGTHVAGIIAATENEAGALGIAQNVELMLIRAVPSGDERDKDIANAIKYAADNGAQVINMSFGKDYSPDAEIVQKAVKYAESKNVLMVHAAGNDNKNNDEQPSYPNGQKDKKNKSTSWMEVGASSSNYGADLPGGFSNYGKGTVDLFAPGVQIFSAIPGDEYEYFSGTSMAAPTVSGVAAFLMSYYPDLSAADVKDILVQSSVKIDLDVNIPGGEEMVPFSELSISGGVVNAYKAVQMAENRVKLEAK